MPATTGRLFAVSIVLLASGARALANNEEWEPLFDGESLAGWTTARGEPITRGWDVIDRMLVRTGGGGSIYTEQEFGDFDLRFEWRISRRGNSGVKYRIAKYPRGIYNSPEWLGYEYQIWDDEHRGTPAHMSAGAIYLLHPPSSEKQLRPVGEFNTARIVAVGPRIEHWLNDEKILEADTSTTLWQRRIANTKFAAVPDIFENTSGRIQLQDHGNKVWFRNLRIRELSDSADAGR